MPQSNIYDTVYLISNNYFKIKYLQQPSVVTIHKSLLFIIINNSDLHLVTTDCCFPSVTKGVLLNI